MFSKEIRERKLLAKISEAHIASGGLVRSLTAEVVADAAKFKYIRALEDVNAAVLVAAAAEEDYARSLMVIQLLASRN